MGSNPFLLTLLHYATHLFQTVADWKKRAVHRSQLLQLDDRLLEDIGITRGQAEQEAAKPFWRA